MIQDRLTMLPRSVKQAVAMLMDGGIVVLAVWAAFALRLADPWPVMLESRWWLLIAMPLVTIPIFKFARLYRTVVRHLGPQFGLALVYGVTFSALCMPLMVLLAQQTEDFSRSAAVIYWLLAIVGVGGIRMLGRGWFRVGMRGGLKPVIIYGAGEAGVQLQASMAGSERHRVIAFVDDQRSSWKTVINGVPVRDPDSLRPLVLRNKCRDIFLAMPSIDRVERRRIIDRLKSLPVTVRTVPSLAELIDGTASLDEVRPIAIEDLLGRDVVEPREELLQSCIRDRVVLVSGAGGSIGSELCRQILRQGPRRLILLERSEVALYEIDRELAEICRDEDISVPVAPILGSVRDRVRGEDVLRTFGVETVYHAAAYKHVPLVEYNISAGVGNNALATWTFAEAAVATGVKTFVLISTDKAVRPTNVMGASKRLAELILQAMQRRQDTTRFCMVRFGNVLDSSGSVVPRFKQQIAARVPITVTHPEVIRYFMTIPEAAELVLQAGSMGTGGDVFVLDMGEAVKIADLARLMIRLAGLTERTAEDPHGDIEIQYTGLRPGEKLYEELLIGDNVSGTEHPMIMRASEAEIPWEELETHLEFLAEACRGPAPESIRDRLRQVVEGYVPEKDIVDLVWQERVDREARGTLPFRPVMDKNASDSPDTSHG
ncbi:MAG: nucleoside-diphosphate sugar epimerase/dehydratase [Planctomycetota bacterium]|nr:nucleoside-diphosphate sugar epimerase/dehydratase [Planctomycetota bacterium]